MDTRGNVLALSWTFGFNSTIVGGVHNLSDGNSKKVLFYASSHTGVLYDWVNSRQQLLQGHCNEICATAVTSDKRWLVTAEKGPNPVLIIWDTAPLSSHLPNATASGSIAGGATSNGPSIGHSTGRDRAGSVVTGGHLGGMPNALPIKTIFDIHEGHGVVAVEFTFDSKYLLTLGNEPKQTIAIWEWTAEASKPLCQIEVGGERQKCIRSNPDDIYEIMTNGDNSVSFFTWDRESGISQHVPVLNSKDFKHAPSLFTCSAFIPTTSESLTATTDGDVVVWTNKSLNNLSNELETGQKAAIKFMRLHGGAIDFVTVVNKHYIVTGGNDGFVKIFDLQFRLVQWFEKFKSGPVISISFSTSNRPDSARFTTEHGRIPEFVAATQHAKVFLVSATNPPTAVDSWVEDGEEADEGSRGQQQAEAAEISVILQGQFDKVYALSAHPNQPLFVVGGYSGVLQLWDYSTKEVVATRRFDAVDEDEDKHALSHSPKKASKQSTKEETPQALKIRTATFSSDGSLIAVGLENGTIRILGTATLEDARPTGNSHGGSYWSVSKKPITHALFSECGTMLAVADGGYGVSVLKKESVVGPRREIEGTGEAIERLAAGKVSYHWVLIGRCQAHYKDIINLIFTPPNDPDGLPSLLSISLDRHAAEYDLAASSITRGVKLKSLKRIEQSARPLAATYHSSLHPHSLSTPPAPHPSAHGASFLHTAPSSTSAAVADGAAIGAAMAPHAPPSAAAAAAAAERFILTANSEFKLKFHNARTQLCRKTVLGPTFGGGPLTELAVMPDVEGDVSRMVAYATKERVVGLTRLPLDGNPHRSTGVIAHPCSISKIVFVHDGSHLLTAGIEDSVVNFWTIHANALDAQIGLGGKDLEPFLSILDESGLGTDGPFYREMEDYFYYAQLRSQGEDATSTRLIQDKVSLHEVPSIMQAMGFYPSEQEIDNLVNEVKYSSLDAGVLVDSVTFGEIIRLFVNHRPVVDYTEADILAAAGCVARLEESRIGGGGGSDGHGGGAASPMELSDTLTKDGLMALLQQYGESMSKQDFEVAFRALLQHDPARNGVFPESLTAHEFVRDVLGLVPVSVKAGGGGGGAGGAGGRNDGAGGDGGGGEGGGGPGGGGSAASASSRVTSASSTSAASGGRRQVGFVADRVMPAAVGNGAQAQ
ncbi:WD40-repeat-containing domain protein [Zopfochytrium polystomum]|nr:WD40-repeat-containing domain protein [Zopfochytrium polystomum]